LLLLIKSLFVAVANIAFDDNAIAITAVAVAVAVAIPNLFVDVVVVVGTAVDIL